MNQLKQPQKNSDCRIVVLDRDGVINCDSDNYIKSVDEWQPISGSLEAIALLTKSDIKVVVATNQSGVGRGLFDTQTLAAMHQKMRDVLSPLGGRIDGIFYCPHLPRDNCDCRKPKAGLLDMIEKTLNQSLEGQIMVGDSLRDMQPAVKKGMKPVLVRTGKGRKTEQAGGLPPNTEVFDDLMSFVKSLQAIA